MRAPPRGCPGPALEKRSAQPIRPIVDFPTLGYTGLSPLSPKVPDPPLPETPPSAAALPARRLTVTGLACRRGERMLFEGLDFAVEPGEALILTGPNGAGKTSLLRILAGLLRPTAGQVALLPEDEELTIAQQSRFVSVRDALKASFTVRETLGFQAEIAGIGRGATMVEAFEAFRLHRLADMPCGYLSSGQRKRVALASLVHAARARPLWLLDEPTNALDRDACGQLARVVGNHLARGGLIVAASHLDLGWPNSRELRIGDTLPAGAAA